MHDARRPAPRIQFGRTFLDLHYCRLSLLDKYPGVQYNIDGLIVWNLECVLYLIGLVYVCLMYPKEWIRKFKINTVISLMWETNITQP